MTIDVYHNENSDAVIVKTSQRAHILPYTLLEQVFNPKTNSTINEICEALHIEKDDISDTIYKIGLLYRQRPKE